MLIADGSLLRRLQVTTKQQDSLLRQEEKGLFGKLPVCTLFPPLSLFTYDSPNEGIARETELSPSLSFERLWNYIINP